MTSDVSNDQVRSHHHEHEGVVNEAQNQSYDPKRINMLIHKTFFPLYSMLLHTLSGPHAWQYHYDRTVLIHPFTNTMKILLRHKHLLRRCSALSVHDPHLNKTMFTNI